MHDGSEKHAALHVFRSRRHTQAAFRNHYISLDCVCVPMRASSPNTISDEHAKVVSLWLQLKSLMAARYIEESVKSGQKMLLYTAVLKHADYWWRFAVIKSIYSISSWDPFYVLQVRNVLYLLLCSKLDVAHTMWLCRKATLSRIVRRRATCTQ